MKTNKGMYRLGMAGVIIALLVLASGCACWKKQPAEELATTEVAAPAPKPEAAPAQAAVTEGSLEKEARQAGALQTIYFDFDKSNLKPDATAKLDITAKWLKSHPEVTLIVEGNCDERGTNEYNMALGERRANSAMRYLVSLGIPEGKVSTMSYGEEKPADPGHDEAAWAKNRRDEFILLTPPK